jgi:hypothetical protein
MSKTEGVQQGYYTLLQGGDKKELRFTYLVLVSLICHSPLCRRKVEEKILSVEKVGRSAKDPPSDLNQVDSFCKTHFDSSCEDC